MRLIYIYGLPGTGKLTVARELAARTGYRLFHNHHVVDLLLSVFEFGSAPFVELREEIWLSVFDHAARSGLPGMIFTFAPENTVRPQFVRNAVHAVSSAGGSVDFVELTCSMPELKQRIGSAARQQHGKLTSVALFEELRAAGNFNSPSMPRAGLTIDTGERTPADSAAEIVQALGLPSALE
jgi:AAA domain